MIVGIVQIAFQEMSYYVRHTMLWPYLLWEETCYKNIM